MVERFDAGLVINNISSDIVLKSVTDIISDYPRYNRNAIKAGQILQQENSANTLYLVLVT